MEVNRRDSVVACIRAEALSGNKFARQPRLYALAVRPAEDWQIDNDTFFALNRQRASDSPSRSACLPSVNNRRRGDSVSV